MISGGIRLRIYRQPRLGGSIPEGGLIKAAIRRRHINIQTRPGRLVQQNKRRAAVDMEHRRITQARVNRTTRPRF